MKISTMQQAPCLGLFYWTRAEKRVYPLQPAVVLGGKKERNKNGVYTTKEKESPRTPLVKVHSWKATSQLHGEWVKGIVKRVSAAVRFCCLNNVIILFILQTFSAGTRNRNYVYRLRARKEKCRTTAMNEKMMARRCLFFIYFLGLSRKGSEHFGQWGNLRYLEVLGWLKDEPECFA